MGKAEAGMFSVLPGGKEIGQGGVNDVGSKAWAKKIRDRAKELSSQLDTGYMEMAQILWTVYDMTLKGDITQRALFKSWGYETFADYTEKELNLHRRKAERLRAIWFILKVQLAAMPEPDRKRIIALGWSKVREMIRVLTLGNAKKWIKLAEQASYPELYEAIQDFLKKKEAGKVQHALEGGKAPKEPEPNFDKLPVSSFDPADYQTGPKAVTEPLPPTFPEDNGDDVPPQPDKLFWKHFYLYPDQMDIVNQALERSAELSESNKPGHNLSLICTEFLATNDFTTASRKQQLKFLANLEKSMGVKLIVADQEDDLIYGIENLQGLVARAKKEMAVDPLDNAEPLPVEDEDDANKTADWDPEPLANQDSEEEDA